MQRENKKGERDEGGSPSEFEGRADDNSESDEIICHFVFFCCSNFQNVQFTVLLIFAATFHCFFYHVPIFPV